mmetsp:Transcript_43163/g.80147  ORF Transcript_43163/g.80147 Transcript_43163/m.80147 type:complete len:80 (-) Transcript_43163:47-286(-)
MQHASLGWNWQGRHWPSWIEVRVYEEPQRRNVALCFKQFKKLFVAVGDAPSNADIHCCQVKAMSSKIQGLEGLREAGYL